MLPTNAKYKKRCRKAGVRHRGTKSHCGKPLHGSEMPLYGSENKKTAAKWICTLYIGIPQRYGAMRYGFI